MAVVLTHVSWNLSVVFFNWGFSNGEGWGILFHIFIGNLFSPFKNCLSDSFAHLYIGCFWCLIFGVLYRFWILVPCLMCIWQRFPPILPAVPLLCWALHFCSEGFKSWSIFRITLFRSPCLCLCLEALFLCSSVAVSVFDFTLRSVLATFLLLWEIAFQQGSTS